MSKFTATRNTCFAIISAIEDDFRSLIEATAKALDIANDVFPVDVRDIAQRRRAVDLRIDAVTSSSIQVLDTELLPYIDFADISKIITTKLASHLENESKWLLGVAEKLLNLTPTRNRVCHTRPLESEDLTNTLDFSETLLSITAPFQFPTLSSTMSRMHSNPGYVLTLQIPMFWNAVVPKVYNNLPMPEFDETGFLGRSDDRLKVLKLLKSHYPVVTIVGEGGVGKTALALRCLYDLLDDQKSDIDAIVWVSMKTSSLTQTGVRELSGAIKSTLGLLTEIAGQLGNPKNEKLSEAELIDEISQYLELYKVVIAIDNLETISTGALRNLLERVPAHSKILLTTRVGVGEFEVRYPLKGLDEKTSISLLRNYSRLLGVNEISKQNEGGVKGYCRQLFYNPLLIKWFVASVGRGADPTKLLNPNGTDFYSALSFCFDNLFDRFGELERIVIYCLLCARKALTRAEIHFLLPALTDIDAEIALSTLHNSSIVLREKTDGNSLEYSLSDSAMKFLSDKSPPTDVFFKNIQQRLRELRTIYTTESKKEVVYDYNPFFVRVEANRDGMIAATYLRSALNFLRVQNIENARNSALEARKLTQESSEVWRICGLIETDAQELYRALGYFEQAIGLAPSSKITLYCYAMFLLSDMEDFQGALDQFSNLEKIDPNAPPVLTAKAMCLTRLGRLDEAASIHDDLLKSIANRERRWRLTGVDQAAETYRRLFWAACDQKEFDIAKTHAKRALSILFEAIERQDIDQKIIQKLAKVISSILSKIEPNNDLNYVDFVVNKAEEICNLGGGISLELAHGTDWLHRNTIGYEGYQARLIALNNAEKYKNVLEVQKLNSPVLGLDQKPQDRIIGKIHNVPEKANYGFIICENGERIYTHATFMRNYNDWSNCSQGVPVSFCMGQNSKGSCAIDVCIMN